jgi:hypothetical protein
VEARALLEKAIELDEMNEDAWLWLSAVVTTPEEQRTCLENVLVINPENKNARQGLQMLGAEPTNNAETVEAAPVQTEDEALLASSFGSQATTTMPEENVFETAASAAEKPAGDNTSDWVSGLNLDIGESDSDMDDDVFAVSPGEFGDEDSVFESTDFGDSLDDSESDDGPFSSAVFGEDDDLFDLSSSEPADSAAFTGGVESPGMEDSTASAEMFVGGDFLTDNFENVEMEQEEDVNFYFHHIPKEISASRLPGTSEKYSPVLLGSVILLGVLNLVMLVALLGKL